MATLVTNTGTQAPGTMASPVSRARLGTAVLWTAQIAAAALFLFAGYAKLSGQPAMVQVFATIGLGQWFRYLTGGIEVVAAVLLFVPSLAFFAASALAVTMVGAVLSHVFILGGSPIVPLLLLATTAAIAWLRAPRFRRFRR